MLESNPDCLIDLNNFRTLNSIKPKIQTRLITKIEIENPVNFYPRPPINYEDNEYDNETCRLDFESDESEISECKISKYKFIPDKDEYSLFPPNFQAPPPPSEFDSSVKSFTINFGENDYEDFENYNENDNEKSSWSITENLEKRNINNFILRPKIPDFEKPKDGKSSGISKGARSLSKGRRKGLEEIFPGIKITRQSLCEPSAGVKNQQDSEFSKFDDPEWCPASDLYDFELDDSDYESNYKMSTATEIEDEANVNFKFKNQSFRKPFLAAGKNNVEISKKKNLDYSEILNSAENLSTFYY